MAIDVKKLSVPLYQMITAVVFISGLVFGAGNLYSDVANGQKVNDRQDAEILELDKNVKTILSRVIRIDERQHRKWGN